MRESQVLGRFQHRQAEVSPGAGLRGGEAAPAPHQPVAGAHLLYALRAIGNSKLARYPRAEHAQAHSPAIGRSKQPMQAPHHNTTRLPSLQSD